MPTTLINPDRDNTDTDCEFTPLPYFSFDERPHTLPLDPDECATAIHLAEGNLDVAAALLKVPFTRLNRVLRHSPRLQRIQSDERDRNVARAEGEYIKALSAPDDRRREWGASKILASRAAMGHPFSPAPAASASTTVSIDAREIVYSWRERGNLIPSEGGTDDASGSRGDD
jgi:hypothetical protein